MSNTPSTDPYHVLGVPRTASPAEIAHAYHLRLRAYHPDTRQLNSTTNPITDLDPDAALRRTIAAYAVLRDPDRRAAYDEHHPAPRRASRADARIGAPPPIRAGPVCWRPS
ncbi:MAG TPA: J domain-containing protein [Nocardioidaceae bacterium]|nr:J domain-containing protein [Nocardioidaceae bacterium]